MKVILRKNLPNLQRKNGRMKAEQLAIVPFQGVEFKLLECIIMDLTEGETASGDSKILKHPDIDLSDILSACQMRDHQKLLGLTSELSIQRILLKWADQPEKVFGLYQVHSLLKKFPFTGKLAKQKAKDTFRSYERHCQLYNTDNYKGIVSLNSKHPDYLGIIEELRADISRLLGDAPDVRAVLDSAQHGPGSALGFEQMGDKVTSYFKWAHLPYTVSDLARPYAREAIETNPQWFGALVDRYRSTKGLSQRCILNMDMFWDWVFEVRNYCRFATVPKNADTDRAIAIEPTLNVFLQLGVDRIIRRRLRRIWQIDLNSQLKNQYLAFKSSSTNEDATVDLRGASDTVALIACYLLLPLEWFNLLFDLRSPNVKIDNEIVPLHKMSAMGNGFTFALETVIFTALARLAMRRSKTVGNLSVFGDDVIIPRQAVPTFYDLLDKFGFMVNKEKSFTDGPFRESCGVDCLNGLNVRPFFLKEKVATVQHLWFIHNSLLELEKRLPWFWEVKFDRAKSLVLRMIPKDLRFIKGPPSETKDCYLFVDGLGYDRNGLLKHPAVVSRAVNYSNRAPDDFFFRKLMVQPEADHRASTQELLRWGSISRLLGRAYPQLSLHSGSGSAFDITMRDNVRYYLTNLRKWKTNSVN